jgi:steroid delta-isomerase-like uncharacterized protein
MSPEELEHFVQRFDAMFNSPDLSIADEIFAPDLRTDQPMGLEFTDLASFKAYVESFYVSFPDLHQEVYDSFQTGDRCVLRVGYFGTHQGEFLGVPATGRRVTMPGIGIFRFEGGKAVENWAQYDVFAVYQQLTA